MRIPLSSHHLESVVSVVGGAKSAAAEVFNPDAGIKGFTFVKAQLDTGSHLAIECEPIVGKGPVDELLLARGINPLAIVF